MQQIQINNFFSKSHDIESILLEELSKSSTSIKIAVAWFTNPKLFKKLIEKLQSGVHVELIITKHEINSLSNVEYEKLNELGGYFIDLYVDDGYMHNKFCIIDNHTVINGSYNWTRKANSSNKENITIIYNDPKTSYDFLREFEILKKLGTGPSAKTDLNLKKVFELFKLFKAFISIGESNKILPYLIQLDNVEEISHIIESLKNENYLFALEQIEKFEKLNTQLVSVSELESQIIKIQIKLLASEIQHIEIQKSDVERHIEQFNHRYIIELHPITLKILKLKKKVYDKARKYADIEDYDSILEEFEKIKDDLKAEEEVEIQDISSEKKEKMKSMFRESANLCHPDSHHCIFESEIEANAFFSTLSSAYKINDFETVQKLWQELKSGSPKNFSELNTEISILKAKLETLKAKRKKILLELSELINSETYSLIKSLDDWNKYFSNMKIKLENQYQELKEKFMN